MNITQKVAIDTLGNNRAVFSHHNGSASTTCYLKPEKATSFSSLVPKQVLASWDRFGDAMASALAEAVRGSRESAEFDLSGYDQAGRPSTVVINVLCLIGLEFRLTFFGDGSTTVFGPKYNCRVVAVPKFCTSCWRYRSHAAGAWTRLAAMNWSKRASAKPLLSRFAWARNTLIFLSIW